MTAKFDLEKFDGKNDFNLWRLRMKALLVQQGLSKALLGSEALPTEMKKDDKAELMEKAHSALLLCLGNDVLREVASEQTAAGLWKKLEERYMTKSLTNRWYLKKRLYMLRMREGTSISDHLNNYNKILMDLENIGATVEEEDRSILLVCSLPSSYENFVETLMYGKESVSVEEIKSALSSRELKKMGNDGISESSGDGLVVRGRANNKGGHHSRRHSKFRKTKDNSCHHCHKEGHWMRDCPERKGKGKQTEVAAIVEEASSNGDVLTVSTNGSEEEWILDSACTYHVTPNRNWFTTYRLINGGKVLMGNNAACEVVGIGTVQIKMYDGIVRTLTEVRHVPDIKKNLISLGTLDSHGCSYKAEGGVIRVIKGVLVVMKGLKEHGLYVLQGSTITGTVDVASSSNQEDETSRMWHMRLGHMSQRGLEVLSRGGLLDGHKIGKLDFCEHCVFGKQCRLKFNTGVHRTKGTLDYIQ